MRILLFTGKGGVGKTTLAAATATALADEGRKTLVVSTDPAHSLADAYGCRLGSEPSEVDTCLHAAQIDSRALVDTAWQDLRGRLRTALAGAGLDALDAEELTVVPGVDELLALSEVRRLAESGPWANVVVDCGPTAETLRLLALPEAVERYLERAFGASPRFGLGRKLHGVTGSVRALGEHVAALRAMLADPEVTTVRLVLTPERVVAAEARRTLTSLALRGIRVDGLIVNRMMPAPGIWRGPAARWMRTRRIQQDEVLAELGGAGIDGDRIRAVEHRATEPVGQSALLDVAKELYDGADPMAGNGSPVTPLLDIIENDGTGDACGNGGGDHHGYVLLLRLPLDPDAALDLARIDDDLAVTVDGFRRLIALPETLRPCRVTGAEATAGGLRVFLARDVRARDEEQSG